MGYTDITESTKRQQSKPKREQYTVVACAKFCSDMIPYNAAIYIETNLLANLNCDGKIVRGMGPW